MGISKKLLLVCLCILLVATEYVLTLATIEHSLQSGVWGYRGSLSKSSKGHQLPIEQQELSSSDLQSLVQLAKANQTYQIRLRSPTSKTDLLYSVPACEVLCSNLIDEIRVGLNSVGQLVYFNYVPKNRDCSCVSKPTRTESLKFKTAAIVDISEEGKTPVFIEAQQPKPGAAPEENQSFFSKYWYYILLGSVLLVLMGGGGSDTPAQGGQAAAGGNGGGRR
eukprot:TRINITY_DN6628_c0_g1_i2.p1 TRINITY_DN6628_c0_g1~~TRINITY_DN6628_c0_g1_i2.p1  ORF type:complete len:222 (-),score=43.08 TRINITY_DN6628_c0_g1_i2:66-731(-)